jgi:[protein-PII] uridylyltransferase
VASVTAVKFQRVELLSKTSDEWVISLQGVDQSGALRTALEALLAEGLSIRWAKVHTWGKSLDDVLGVEARADLVAEDVVERLSRRLC